MSADLMAWFTAQQVLLRTQAISYNTGLLETGIDGNLRVEGQIAGTSDLTIGLPLAPANVDFTVGTMAISGLTGNITSNVLYYDTSSGGMTYGDIIRPTSFITPTSATPIDLTASSSGNVYVLTGNTTQRFTHTSLTPADAGVFVFVKNGNGTGGSDITISGATGTLVVHHQTNQFNGQILVLHWNGSALISH